MPDENETPDQSSTPQPEDTGAKLMAKIAEDLDWPDLANPKCFIDDTHIEDWRVGICFATMHFIEQHYTEADQLIRKYNEFLCAKCGGTHTTETCNQ